MNDQLLRLHYSPCPNDTFIFHGLASGLVPLPGFRLETSLADVEVLNARAARGEADVCKVSFAAAAGLLDDWLLLRAGGAMGRGVGPVLVAREGTTPDDLRGKAVAIPGSRTTANLLFGLYCRELGMEVERVELVFDQIMPAVARGEVAAGVVIHEGRFTYAEHGLSMLTDLGRWWEERRGLPIPLGVIAVRRALGPDVAGLVQDAIRRSLDLARGGAAGLWDFIRSHAQEMDEAVIRRHIETFVTDFSWDIGEEGRRAALALFSEARPGALPGPVFLGD
ncbi:1,4-dihydroxy-6-naphthoate synthase [Desulfovibrio sp.]